MQAALAGVRGQAAAAAAPTAGEESKAGVYVDLTPLVTTKCVQCFNQDRRHTAANLWMGDERLQLQSDLDPQLLLIVPFSSTVKVNSINLVAPTSDASLLPTSLKIFANKPDLDLEEVEDFFPTQEFELTPKDFEAESVLKLKFHKFQKVNSLTLFFDHDDDDDDHDDVEKSILSSIKFFGKNTQNTDMSQFKKVG